MSLIPLTPRELEILPFYARIGSKKLIAAHFGTSPDTVNKQLASIRRKLGANDRTAVVIAALQQGLLSLSEITN